jgi:hypothetical protein
MDVQGFRVNEREIYEPCKRWDYENGFWLTSGTERMEKVIAHWVFANVCIQQNQAVGDIVECGVFKGSSLIQWALYRKFMAAEDARKLIAFDAYGTFQSKPEDSKADDVEFVKSFKSEAGSGMTREELEKVFAYKGFKNYEFILGDVAETLPEYLKANPQLRIALLHVDVDTYKPTYDCLEHLYNRVTRGWVIVFDDYGKVAGATSAIEHYFKNNKIQAQIRQLAFARIGFMIKG